MLLPDYEELVSLKNQMNPAKLFSKVKATESTMGGHTSLFKGHGLDFSEVREYALGDDIRSIDWRVTARMGRTHTKVFTEERERSVYLIVDINNYMEFGTRQTFKSIQAARAASLIAWRAHRLHDKTGAILFGHIPEKIRFLPAERSRKSIWDMLKTLCTPGARDEEASVSEALVIANRRIPVGSTIFIISDFFRITQEFEKQLGLLARRNDVTLIRVSDPADQSLPQVDEVRFSNSTGSEAIINTSDVAGAKRYQQFWSDNEVALTELVNRFRAKLINVSTDRDVIFDLVAGVSAPAEGRKSS